MAPILPLFVAGAAILTTITVFQYFLQYAHGDLSLNVRFNTVLFVISVPLITHAAFEYGVAGVAWVVFSTRLISFCLWVPFVHSKLAPGIHRDWLLNSVAKPLMIPLALLSLINQLTGEIAASLSSQLGALGFMALVATSGYGALALWLLPCLDSCVRGCRLRVQAPRNVRNDSLGATWIETSHFGVPLPR